MFSALSAFLIYCRIERRLADLTCKAYERDVRACLELLRGEEIAEHGHDRIRSHRNSSHA
jgi:site-specific recombinase XerD